MRRPGSRSPVRARTSAVALKQRTNQRSQRMKSKQPFLSGAGLLLLASGAATAQPPAPESAAPRSEPFLLDARIEPTRGTDLITIPEGSQLVVTDIVIQNR